MVNTKIVSWKIMKFAVNFGKRQIFVATKNHNDSSSNHLSGQSSHLETVYRDLCIIISISVLMYICIFYTYTYIYYQFFFTLSSELFILYIVFGVIIVALLIALIVVIVRWVRLRRTTISYQLHPPALWFSPSLSFILILPFSLSPHSHSLLLAILNVLYFCPGFVSKKKGDKRGWKGEKEIERVSYRETEWVSKKGREGVDFALVLGLSTIFTFCSE